MQGSSGLRLPSIALAVVLGACGGPSATASPAASPAAGPSSSPVAVVPTPLVTALPSPTPIVSPTPGPLPTGSDYVTYPEFGYVSTFVMRVAVSELNVRRKPSKNGISEGKAPKGGLFMMYDWPITADGYTWYYGFTLLTDTPGVLPDLPAVINTGYDEVLGGWMATGTEDTPFLIPLAPRCPDVADLSNVGAMLTSERVSCFGSASLMLEGTIGCEGCGGASAGTFEPEWLASRLEFAFLSVGFDETMRALALYVAPDGPARPADGARVRVRGHFSDTRSATCRITELGPGDELSVPIANAAAEQWCRGKFVVESIEVLG